MDNGRDGERRGVALVDGVIWSQGPINSRHNRVLIVCNGPSAERMRYDNPVMWATLSSRAHVIVVNGAVNWFPVSHSFFSLDPSAYVRGLLNVRRAHLTYWIAVPPDYGTPTARLRNHRDPAEMWVNYLVRQEGDGFRGACHGLSERNTHIHTGNSGYGALGLAYLMHARKIAFIGLDGGGDRYAHGRPDSDHVPRPPFDYMPELFASAIPQLDKEGVAVVNGSPESAVSCWPRMMPSAAIKWLLE